MQYTREELLRYTGNPTALCAVTEYEHAAGRMRGTRSWQVRAGALQFELLPDKCLDIATLSYKGVPVAWQSKGGPCGPAQMQAVAGEFAGYFGGGMLWTCGLKNTGDEYVDRDGMFQHAHGRIGITPCEQAWHRTRFAGDELVAEAGGVTRESLLGAHNLTLTRSLRVSASEACVEIEDTLENHEPEETDYLILYHFNFGFPFLCPQTVLDCGPPAAPVRPRNDDAAAGLGAWDRFTEPVTAAPEQCFFHSPTPGPDGLCEVRAENPKLGFGAAVAWDRELLPVLTEWKSMRAGEYVLGLEPGNSYLRGMETERVQGSPGRIEGFGSRRLRVRLRFYDLNAGGE